MKTVFNFSVTSRKKRRRAIELIGQELYRVYEAEHRHMVDMELGDPEGEERYNAQYSSDILLDILLQLAIVYE